MERIDPEEILKIFCPTCGAMPGEALGNSEKHRIEIAAWQPKKSKGSFQTAPVPEVHR
jgi:hypothetical protein